MKYPDDYFDEDRDWLQLLIERDQIIANTILNKAVTAAAVHDGNQFLLQMGLIGTLPDPLEFGHCTDEG